MNKVHFEGRLIRDPEQRTTTTGKTLAKFSLAVRDTRNESQTFFFDCTAWEPVASQIIASVKKNDLIAVDGRLTTNIYTNREGKSVKAYDTIVENVRLLSKDEGAFRPSRTNQAYVSIDDMPDPAPRPAAPKAVEPPAAGAKTAEELFAKKDKEEPAADVKIDWLKDLE